MASVAKHIRKLRLERGLTQEELAEIRRFLPMHQWGDFAFTEQFLAACPQFRDRTVPVVRQGQQFTWE